MSLDTDLMPKTSREVWVLHGVNVYFICFNRKKGFRSIAR